MKEKKWIKRGTALLLIAAMMLQTGASAGGQIRSGTCLLYTSRCV